MELPGIKQLFKTIKKILYILPEGDSWKIGLLFFLMLIAAGLEVAGIGMIPAFVAIVADPESILSYEPLQFLFSFLSIKNSEDLLLWGSIGLVGVFIIKSVYLTTFNYYESRFIYNRRYLVSYRLMSAYMQAPYTFHLQRNTSELLRNLINEINILSNVIFANLLLLSKEIIMSLSILIFLFAFEPIITAIVLLLAGLGAGTFILFTQKKVKKYGREEQERRSNLVKAVNQGLGGIKAARVLNRESEFIERFRIEAYKSTRLKAFIRFIQQIPKPVVETTAVLGMMLISALMVWQGRPMTAIIPILTLFAMALVRLMPSVQQISSLYTNLQYNIVSVDPIYNDLKELEEFSGKLIEDRKKNQRISLANQIDVKKVNYNYPGTSEMALQNVSFTIQKGEAVGFVGESGAGKTTIVDVLLGLLEPSGGEVLVDGTNIHQNLSAWQKNIGYIPQSIYLADESLRRNIAFGLPDEAIEDERVMEAVKLAQLESMVNQFSNKLDTFVGEDGTRLSGGQRQRIGIARALYHDPDVIVMDEATSALDNITEMEISKAIEALKGERTVIIIAHRLTTVQNCDCLYLMKDGKIIDSGTYYELIDKNQEFKKMALIDVD